MIKKKKKKKVVDSQTSSSSCPAKGQPSQFLVNAAPCRMLAWGKSLLNVKSCVSPTGPDHSKNRETVFSDHCHQTGPVSGDRRDRNVCQTSKCPECGTHLPVGSRLTPFRDLGSLGGWTLGSTNVEGGLHSPFPVKTKLDKVTQIIKCYAHLHRNLYWLEALHQIMDKEWCSRASSKSLGFFNLAWFQNHTTIGDLF